MILIKKGAITINNAAKLAQGEVFITPHWGLVGSRVVAAYIFLTKDRVNNEQRTDLMLASMTGFAIIREPFTYYNRVTTWSRKALPGLPRNTSSSPSGTIAFLLDPFCRRA